METSKEAKAFDALRQKDSIGLQSLLAEGVNPNVSTPKHTLLTHACSNNDLKSVEVLLAAKADPNLASPAGMRPLHAATDVGAQNEILFRLLEAQADIEGQDKNQETALQMACTHRNPRLAKFLLEAQANPNAQNGFGTTAAHLAAFNITQQKEASIAQLALLKAAGANPDLTDCNGITILHYLMQGPVSEILPDWITPKTLNAATLTEKNTPLHEAVFYNQPTHIEILLAAGASLTAKNQFGQTPADLVTPQTDPRIQTFLNKETSRRRAAQAAQVKSTEPELEP